MDEARAVLERLGHIDALERSGAPAPELLDELRALVVEAEAPSAAARDDHGCVAVGQRSQIRDGVRAILPLAVAVPAFGLSFGVLAAAAGMGELAPVVMSATTFAGSAQFAAASVLDASGGAGCDRCGDPAQRPLRADEHRRRARLRGAGLATAAHVTTDRGRVVGALRSRWRPLRRSRPDRSGAR